MILKITYIDETPIQRMFYVSQHFYEVWINFLSRKKGKSNKKIDKR